MPLAEPNDQIPKSDNRSKIYPFCLANDSIFRAAVQEFPEVLAQRLVDALFPTLRYHIDQANFEETFVGNEVLAGCCVDSLTLDKKNRTLFDIEMQLYKLDINRSQQYYNAIRRRADTPNGYEVPIQKIYIIFFCNSDPMEMGLPIYSERVGCEQTYAFREAGFEFIYIDMRAQKEGPLADVCHDLLCHDPNQMIDARFADMLRHYKRSPDEIRRRNMTWQQYNAQKEKEKQETARLAVEAERIRLSEEYAITSLKKGLSVELVCDLTKLPEARVLELYGSIKSEGISRRSMTWQQYNAQKELEKREAVEKVRSEENKRVEECAKTLLLEHTPIDVVCRATKLSKARVLELNEAIKSEEISRRSMTLQEYNAKKDLEKREAVEAERIRISEECAIAMLKHGATFEFVCEVTKLPETRVQEIAKSMEQETDSE